MHNVLQILRRDFKRLVTVPAAWVIMIGLILIPPLYAWFNICLLYTSPSPRDRG